MRGEFGCELEQRLAFGLLTQLEGGDGPRDAAMFLIGQPVIAFGSVDMEPGRTLREDLEPVVPVEHFDSLRLVTEGQSDYPNPADGDICGPDSGKLWRAPCAQSGTASS